MPRYEYYTKEKILESKTTARDWRKKKLIQVKYYISH